MSAKAPLQLPLGIQIAQRPEQFEALARFRYQIYVDELCRRFEGLVDHEGEQLHDPSETQAGVWLFYRGELDDIEGMVRLRSYAAGRVPPEVAQQNSLAALPGAEALPVAELSTLLIRNDRRGHGVAELLVLTAMNFCMGHTDAELIFVSCPVGVVRMYRSVGCRLFGGRPSFYPGDPPAIPMVVVLSGRAHFESLGSPAAALSATHFGPGKRPVLDTTAFEPVFERAHHSVCFERQQLLREVERLCALCPDTPLASLSEDGLTAVVRSCFAMSVDLGDPIIARGVVEREVFVILEGRFELSDAEGSTHILERGQVFGQAAFFSEDGRRRASVVALGEGRLLVLRRRFLDELRIRAAEDARALELQLSHLLAQGET